MVSPSQKKSAVAHAVDRRLCSVRRACTYLNLPRSTYRYVPKRLTDRPSGSTSKQVKRIRRREGLKVREKPKKIPRRGISTGLPTQATHRHHVWTWDFIFDRTDNGRTLKMMTLLDEYSRPSLAIQVERQITGA